MITESQQELEIDVVGFGRHLHRQLCEPKPTEIADVIKRLNSDEALVNTGHIEITALPPSGEGCGDRVLGLSQRALSLKKRSSRVI